VQELINAVDTIFKLPDRDMKQEAMFAAEHIYTIQGRGTVITGKLHRGTLKKGDKVEIVGQGKDTVKTVISGLESFKKTVDQAEPGDQLGILLRGLGPKDVRRGCVLLPQDHKHNITDRAKAQMYVLKPEEGGSKLPIANYFVEHLFSLTYDCSTSVKIVGKDFIMPGENAEVELTMVRTNFIEPQQRFTLRKGDTTIATGMFTEVLPKQTNQEKDKKTRKKLLKAEMERLGFSPYERSWEAACKPDYSNSPKSNPMEAKFEEAKAAAAK